MLQILIAILAGILTAGAPCILPMLPILLGSSVGRSSKTRPLFIMFGFILTFSLAGLFLSYLITNTGLQVDTLRNISIAMLAVFAVLMVWPLPFEKLMLRMGNIVNKSNQMVNKDQGNFGGFLLGATLGVIWTPCAGPVLGSILTLIVTSQDLGSATMLLVAYAIGAGIPMLLVAYGSQYITTKVQAIAPYAGQLQKIFGFIILLLAIAMFLKYDLILQAKIIDYYPGIIPKF